MVQVVRRFREFLGRLGFVARLLVWVKPRLGPLCSWQAAVTASTVSKLPDTVILNLDYLSRTFADMSFKVSVARPKKGVDVVLGTCVKSSDITKKLKNYQASKK